MRSSDSTEPQDAVSVSPDAMRVRFKALWHRCLIRGASNGSQEVWEAMEARYREPHRHYHDQRHLAHCLGQLDLAKALPDRPDAVEMALWFHDVVNDPGQTDNEAQSAAFFRSWADEVMEPSFVETVVGLILATTHREPSEDRDRQIVCDIDLASFGCQWDCYKQDTDNIKAEYPGSEEDYYRSKRAFLQAMLSKSRIFQSDFFHARYEQQARENIRRLLGLVERQQD